MEGTNFGPKTQKALSHVGVKGMRWGFRKGKAVAGARVREGSADHVESRRIRRMSVMDMSNDELRAVNTRLQLEQSYRSLNPNVVQRGQRLINQALGVADTVSKVETFGRSPQGQRMLSVIRDRK